MERRGLAEQGREQVRPRLVGPHELGQQIRVEHLPQLEHGDRDHEHEGDAQHPARERRADLPAAAEPRRVRRAPGPLHDFRAVDVAVDDDVAAAPAPAERAARRLRRGPEERHGRRRVEARAEQRGEQRHLEEQHGRDLRRRRRRVEGPLGAPQRPRRRAAPQRARRRAEGLPP